MVPIGLGHGTLPGAACQGADLATQPSVGRGQGSVADFVVRPVDITGVSCEAKVEGPGVQMRVALLSETDQNRCVAGAAQRFDRTRRLYFSGSRPDQRHIAMFVSQSFVGTIVLELRSDGKLDRSGRRNADSRDSPMSTIRRFGRPRGTSSGTARSSAGKRG